jgi:hypothetical protein
MSFYDPRSIFVNPRCIETIVLHNVDLLWTYGLTFRRLLPSLKTSLKRQSRVGRAGQWALSTEPSGNTSRCSTYIVTEPIKDNNEATWRTWRTWTTSHLKNVKENKPLGHEGHEGKQATRTWRTWRKTKKPLANRLSFYFYLEFWKNRADSKINVY